MRHRFVLGLVVILLIQEAVVPQLRIAGRFPDLVAGYVTLAGLVGGPTRGALVGFVGGLGEDLFLNEPFGMSALVYTLVGYATGTLLRGTTLASSRLGVSAAASIGSATGVAGYALLGALLGQTHMLTSDLGPTIGIVATVNFALGAPIAALVRWSLPATIAIQR